MKIRDKMHNPNGHWVGLFDGYKHKQKQQATLLLMGLTVILWVEAVVPRENLSNLMTTKQPMSSQTKAVTSISIVNADEVFLWY